MSTPYDADPQEPGTAAPGEHLDADLLGDLDEGLLDADAAAAAHTHLERCATCSWLHDEYLSVRQILAELPPVQMPDDMARRLDEAIGAAAAGGPGSVPSSGATVVPLTDRPRRRRLPGIGVLQAAAAAVVIAAVAAVGVSAISELGGSDDSTASSPAAGGAVAKAEADSSTRFSATQHAYSAGTLAADATRLARGEGPVPAAAAPSARETRTPVSADRQPTRRALSATDALTGAEALNDTALSKVGLPSRAAIDRCTQALGEGRPPLAVDRGSFNGEEVLVVVFGREAPDPGYEAWVVGTRCAPGDEQVRTFVLAPG